MDTTKSNPLSFFTIEPNLNNLVLNFPANLTPFHHSTKFFNPKCLFVTNDYITLRSDYQITSIYARFITATIIIVAIIMLLLIFK